MAHRKLAPGKLVIASHNAGKVREIRALLEPFGMAWINQALMRGKGRGWAFAAVEAPK